MKLMIVFLLIAATAPAWAQVPGPGQAPAQVQDAQRRAELRKVLQQGQTAAPGHRQLNAQERADLREALRRQRAEETAVQNAPQNGAQQAGGPARP